MSKKETKLQEFRRRSQTESVTITIGALLFAKNMGIKVRRVSPFGLTFEEAGHIYSMDGRYFRCCRDPDLIKYFLEDVKK